MSSVVPSADRIILLASFPDSIAAHMAKSRLDAEEIPCFVSNENRPYGPISGGVRLHVRQQDAEAARTALLEETVPMTILPDPDTQEGAVLTCARCGSPDIATADVRPGAPTAPGFFTRLIYSLRGIRYHCFHCGYELREE